jgi:AbiTii
VSHQIDHLAAIERDVLDRAAPLADILRSCLYLARRTQAGQLDEWASAELKGYTVDSVPGYRKVAAPILRVFDVPGRGLVPQIFNPQTVPEFARKHLSGIVPLTQPIDELEGYISQYGPQNKQVELEVFGSDLLMMFWNENNPYGPRAVSMYWSISPAVIIGVVGQVRTALTELVAKLRNEVGDGADLPSAEQADEALRAALPSVTFNNSSVTVVTATTKSGDIMPDGPRTTIKGNKTEIREATGNVSVASAHVVQVNSDGVDVEKIRQFTDLVTQIAPTLGLSTDQRTEVQVGVDDLQAAATDTRQDKGRIRSALSRVLHVLGAAGTSAAQQVAVQMGDDLVRELGTEIVRELPH